MGKDKIINIERPTITPEDKIGRAIEFEDGTGMIQTYFRPMNIWFDHGMDVGTQMIHPGVSREFLEGEGYTDAEIAVILEGIADA